MLFSQPISRVPIPYDPALASQILKKYSNLSPTIQNVIQGIAGSSPYLNSLLATQNHWLLQNINTDPDTIYKEIFNTVIQNSAIADISTRLRTAKKHIALLLALCDLTEIWALEKITQCLTEFADFSVNQACKDQVAKYRQDGILSHHGEFGGLSVLAMGKMGAYELNYSSDIDLIFLFDDKLYPHDKIFDIRMVFTKITQSIYKILSENKADGYVFRTDLRLRPNPSITPICPTISSCENYYTKEGRTWERAAFIKARACAGDITIGQRFLEQQKHFIWRKQLDFASIEEIQNILTQARQHKGVNGPITILGHDMKMGRGGIREIEFFTQTLQLTYGGRDTKLQSPNTIEALKSLAEQKLLSKKIVAQLSTAYRHHRNIEHRIQMLRDAQTHRVPKTLEGIQQLSNLSGNPDVQKFSAEILKQLEITRNATKVTQESSFNFTENIVPTTVQKTIFDTWIKYSALRSDRTVEIINRLKPMILHTADSTSNPDQFLEYFDLFLSQLTSGVQLFSLFEKRPEVFTLLMKTCALSKPLAHKMAQQTQILDGLADRSMAPKNRDVKTYTDIITAIISEPTDLEKSLNQIRVWHQEEHFRNLIDQLSSFQDFKQAEQNFSNLAEASIKACIDLVKIEMQRRYGHINDSDVSVLAMGKLGSQEMTCTSDLDIIVIFSGDQNAQSNGKRTLDTRSYYAKFTRILISALSSSMQAGKLYEVDMRLRPSGKSGPVATSLSAFEDYQKNKAWVWEHLALSRSRVVAANPEMEHQINIIRQDILSTHVNHSKIITEVKDMISRLRNTPPKKGINWPIKRAAGGILEIELLAQASTLLNEYSSLSPCQQFQDAVTAKQISSNDAEEFIEIHQFLCTIEHLKRLLLEANFKSKNLSDAAISLFLANTGTTSISALGQQITQKMARAKNLIDTYLIAELRLNIN